MVSSPRLRNTTCLHSLTSNATDYDGDDVAELYRLVKRDYHWFYGSLRCNLLSQVKSLTPHLNNLNIIDVACGDGNISKFLIENNSNILQKDSIDIIGIDKSESQVSLANSGIINYNMSNNDNYSCNIKYEIGNANDIRYKEKFDVAILFWVFLYSPNIQQFNQMMKSCYQCLKKDGIAIGATAIIKDIKQMDKFDDKNMQEKYGLRYIYDKTQNLDNGQTWTTYFEWTKTKDNKAFPVSWYFFNQNIQNKIAKDCGFTNGFEIIDSNQYTYYTFEMNDNQIQLAKDYFAMQQHCNMFVLKK